MKNKKLVRERKTHKFWKNLFLLTWYTKNDIFLQSMDKKSKKWARCAAKNFINLIYIQKKKNF